MSDPNGHTKKNVSVWVSHELRGEVRARNTVMSYSIEVVLEAVDLDEIGVGGLYREGMRALMNIEEAWGTPVFNDQVRNDESEKRRLGEEL